MRQEIAPVEDTLVEQQIPSQIAPTIYYIAHVPEIKGSVNKPLGGHMSLEVAEQTSLHLFLDYPETTLGLMKLNTITIAIW